MEDDAPVPDHLAGFIAATLAPAAIAGLIALPIFGPFALAVFMCALMIAMLHVIIVAAPLYVLISHLWRPGPVTILVLAPLIGGAPVTLLAWNGLNAGTGIFALCGFVGGIAFLIFANRMPVNEGY